MILANAGRTIHFCGNLLQAFNGQHLLGHNLLQPGVLRLQILELARIGNRHVALLVAPTEKRLLSNVVLAADLPDHRTVGFSFPQDSDDLFFCESLLDVCLHVKINVKTHLADGYTILSRPQVLFGHRATLPVQGALRALRFEGTARNRRLVILDANQEMTRDVTVLLVSALLRSFTRVEDDGRDTLVIHSGKHVNTTLTPDLLQALERLQDTARLLEQSVQAKRHQVNVRGSLAGARVRLASGRDSRH